MRIITTLLNDILQKIREYPDILDPLTRLLVEFGWNSEQGAFAAAFDSARRQEFTARLERFVANKSITVRPSSLAYSELWILKLRSRVFELLLHLPREKFMLRQNLPAMKNLNR